MIEKVEDLELDEVKDLTSEKAAAIVEEKLGVSLSQMTAALQQALQATAEQVAENYRVIAPLGDYSKMLEEQQDIANFFRDEASKPEYWKLSYLSRNKDPKHPQMLQLIFRNTAVEKDDSLEGSVFISFTGIIRHVFITGDP